MKNADNDIWVGLIVYPWTGGWDCMWGWNVSFAHFWNPPQFYDAESIRIFDCSVLFTVQRIIIVVLKLEGRNFDFLMIFQALNHESKSSIVQCLSNWTFYKFCIDFYHPAKGVSLKIGRSINLIAIDQSFDRILCYIILAEIEF